MKYWRTVRAQTDIRNPDGGYLYADCIVRPSWYWFLRRLRLFSQLVWRRWEPGFSRIGIRLAWKISSAANGPTEKDVKASFRKEMNALQRQRKLLETKRENVKE